MNIFYITRARVPSERAHSLQIIKMCQAYAGLGNDITLIVPKRKNHIKNSIEEYYQIHKNFNFEYILVPYLLMTNLTANLFFGRIMFWLESLFFLISLLLRIHIPKESLIITRSIEVAFFYKIQGYTVLYEIHDWPHSFKKLNLFLIKKIHNIICTSQGLANELLDLKSVKVIVAHNGVDESFFHSEINEGISRKLLNIPQDKIVVMYIGSLGAWKGVETLLKASEELDDRYVVVIAGGNNNEINSLKTDFPKVIFLGGTPLHLLPQYQQLADLLVVPNSPNSVTSEKYTSPIKLFAHMTSHKPILVTDLSSIREIVNENEVFFFDGSVSDLVTQILYIFEHQDSILKKTEAAYNLVKEMTWNKRAEKILDYFALNKK